ncbi:MAG: SDR family NAD(P)-dependent oxidoreductase [Bacteroidales bacterium]|jgi:3-oxoacyl-[acyl-carrier-protein] synthase-3|nr:SDR family NAD(P)-dependent oxidoreductase [Bacteroidales bacterium]
MYENYYFSGFGFFTGKFKIKNSDIEEAIDKGFLQGFNKSRILKNENYQNFLKNNTESTPLEFFAGEIMGFKERYYVTPFPPTRKKLYYAESSLELAVKAIKNALIDSQVQATEIGAWFASTVSPHEQAPGIAATIKSFFCKSDNFSPAISTISGCAGFLINVEKAVNFLKSHSEVNHVVVAHTETMSSFLTQRIKYVPFVTFGDTAAAIIISKTNSFDKFGIIDVSNFHDLKMLDYVGVDNNSNLYMDDKFIKDRAIENIPIATKICLKKSAWEIDDIDLFVPHQTGNIIIKPAAEKLQIPKEKIFMEAQNYYGNVSGSTIPLSLCLLNEQKKLQDGTKIMSATAGVGGNYGAFSYIHKQKNKKNEDFYLYYDDLKGKNILIIGASENLGFHIANECNSRGANLFLHCSSNNSKVLSNFGNPKMYNCDISNKNNLQSFLNELIVTGIIFDYLIIASSGIDKENALQENFFSIVEIINCLVKNHQIKSKILKIGCAMEDSKCFNDDLWLSSNRAIHGFLASASGEFSSYGINTVYLQPAFLEDGISSKINQKTVSQFMYQIGQNEMLSTEDFSKDVVNSLYLHKVLNFSYSYENTMLVGRIGYKPEVDL